MKKILVIIIIFFISFFGSKSLSAQYMEVGALGGTSFYMGDLNPKLVFNMPQPAGGLIVRYNFSTRYVARLNVMIGSIKGDDATTQAVENRNLNFTNQIMEVSAQIEINFLTFFAGSKKDRFSPYIFFGLGAFSHEPKAIYNGVEYSLKELNTEGQGSLVYPDRKTYSLTQLCIPFGAGIKYSLNSRWIVGAEWGMRKTFTDYLDDVSQTYYFDSSNADEFDAAFVLSDPTMNHDVGMQRGDPQFSDFYSFAGITLTYKINITNEKRCRDFQNSYKFE